MHTFSRSSQKGFSLLEVLLAVTIAISLGSMQLGKIKRETESIQAKAVGEQLKMVGGALNDYIALQYNNLVDMTTVNTPPWTADDPGPRTCNTGTGICTITSDTLRRAGLLPASFSGRNAYGATYEYYIRVSGAAPNWQIDGIVVTNEPYSIGGLPRFDLIGQAMNEAGADSGTTRVVGSRLDGYNGAWQETGYPINQVGLLGYRVGYGTSGFVSFLRIDGANNMTGNLKMGDGTDPGTNRDIEFARNITASQTIQGNKLVATSGTADAIVVGAGAGAKTFGSGTDQQTFKMVAANGLEVMGNAAGTVRSKIIAGDGNFQDMETWDLISRDIEADSIIVNGLADVNSLNVDGGVTVFGNYESDDGNILLDNGNIATGTGTVSAASLIAGTSTFTDNMWTMGRGGGWYMTDNTWMRVQGDKGIFTPGEIRGGTIRSTGNVIANGYLQVGSTQTAGGGCATVGTFSKDSTGRMLQCVSGIWRLASGVNSATTVVSAQCTSGATCTATCPSGRTMTGGGYVLVTRPSVTDPTGPERSVGSGNSWIVRSVPGAASVFQAQAVCVD